MRAAWAWAWWLNLWAARVRAWRLNLWKDGPCGHDLLTALRRRGWRRWLRQDRRDLREDQRGRCGKSNQNSRHKELRHFIELYDKKVADRVTLATKSGYLNRLLKNPTISLT